MIIFSHLLAVSTFILYAPLKPERNVRNISPQPRKLLARTSSEVLFLPFRPLEASDDLPELALGSSGYMEKPPSLMAGLRRRNS